MKTMFSVITSLLGDTRKCGEGGGTRSVGSASGAERTQSLRGARAKASATWQSHLTFATILTLILSLLIIADDTLAQVPQGQAPANEKQGTYEGRYLSLARKRAEENLRNPKAAVGDFSQGLGGMLDDPSYYCGEDQNCKDRWADLSHGQKQFSVNVMSPMTGLTDHSFSTAIKDQYNNLASSEVARLNATWAMVEPAYYSALAGTISQGLAYTQSRYLADLQISDALRRNPEIAQSFEKALAKCYGDLLSQGKTYVEAQETCLGGRNKEIPEPSRYKNVNMNLANVLNYGMHPEFLDKQQLKIVKERDLWTGKDEDYYTIHLSNMLFDTQVATAQAGASPTVLAALKKDWQEMIGDVVFQSRAVTPDNGQYFTGQFKIKFTRQDPTGNDKNNLNNYGFPEVVRRRFQSVYNSLYALMYAKCENQNGVLDYPVDVAAGDFWKLVSVSGETGKKTPYQPKNGADNIPKEYAKTLLDHVANISTRDLPMYGALGDAMWKGLVDKYIPKKVDPAVAESEIRDCPMLNSWSDKGWSRLQKSTDTPQNSPVINDGYMVLRKYAELISASQILGILATALNSIENTAGGLYPSEIQGYAVDLLRTSTGIDDVRAASNEFSMSSKALAEQIFNAYGVAPSNESNPMQAAAAVAKSKGR